MIRVMQNAKIIQLGGASKSPGTDLTARMNELKRAAKAASERLIDRIDHRDSDAIVRALGGGFKKDREVKMQGGHSSIILKGDNGRYAVIDSTKGIIHGKVRIFEKEEE